MSEAYIIGDLLKASSDWRKNKKLIGVPITKLRWYNIWLTLWAGTGSRTRRGMNRGVRLRKKGGYFLFDGVHHASQLLHVDLGGGLTGEDLL